MESTPEPRASRRGIERGIPRPLSVARTRVLVGLLLILSAIVFIVDLNFSRGRSLPAGPYAVPVLFAAYLLEPIPVLIVAVTSLALELASAVLEQVPPPVWGLDLAGLAMVGLLSVTLAAKMQRETALTEQAESSLSELRAVLDSMDEGVTICDLRGAIVGANRVALQLYGFAGEAEVLNNDWRRLSRLLEFYDLEGHPVPQEERPLARIVRGETISGLELRVRRSATGRSWIGSFSGRPVIGRDGKVILSVLTTRDVTAQKQAEQFRNEFVGLISHDLRSPLTAIMGHASMLERSLSEKNLNREAASARVVLESTRRMNAMIQELVDSTRLESGAIELKREPVDLCQLLGDVPSMVGSPKDQTRIKVECECQGEQVVADRERLERVVANLVSNAIKYSPPESEVTLRAERRHGEIVVSVEDRGVGIPSEEQPFVFDRFYRARTGKKAEGLGLGLYISRMIVAAHQGRIWVESRRGGGSTFSFALPASEDESE